MGTIEYGSPQLLTFDYNQSATAKLFNGINFKLTPTGIYEGFTLTRISNSYITVSVGTCFRDCFCKLSCINNTIGMRVIDLFCKVI